MIYCAKTKLNKNRTIYIENPLKSYDFSGFPGPSDWFRTSGLLNPTEAENFFRTFLAIFYRFRSYSVTLVTSLEPPFPPVPRASVVIHVVKNASRQKRQEAFLHSSAGLSKEILFHIRDAAILIAEPFIIRETISAVSNHIEPAG